MTLTPHLFRFTFCAASLAFITLISTAKASVVLLNPNDPVVSPGSALGLDPNGIPASLKTALDFPGTQITLLLYVNSGSIPVDHTPILAQTAVFTEPAPGDFELTLSGGPITLGPGTYWLQANVVIPSQAPNTSQIFGFIAMPFTLNQELTISGAGFVNSGDTFDSYLRVSPVPESSSASLAAGAVLLVAFRRRRR